MNTRISSVITQTMTTPEIADLCQKRHDNVMRVANVLASKGIIQSPQIEVCGKINSLGLKRKHKAYRLTKTESINLVANLSPEFTAAIIDRWQELENQVRQPALAPQLRRYLDHKRTVPDHYFIALEVVALELIAPLHDSGFDILKEMMPESSFVRSWNKELRQASEVIEGFPTHLVETEWGKFVPERCYPDRLLVAGRNHFWSTWLPEKAPQYLKHRQLAALSAIPKAYPALQKKLNNYVPMFPAEYGQNNLF